MKKQLLTYLTFAILGLVHLAIVQAQTPLQFEVATIKPADPNQQGVRIMFQPGGNLKVEGGSVKMMITLAYNVRDFQVTGGPSWLGSERYDITAKSEQPAEPIPFPKMTEAQRNEFQQGIKDRLKTLLADRFHLVVREEMKEMPVYALVQAKNGSKLKVSNPEDLNKPGSQGITMRPGILTGSFGAVRFLADTLSNIVGRPVIDKTGLDGKYDWKLEWTPDRSQLPPGMARPENPANPPDISGPSVFTALEEQLGLKLEGQKAPAPVIIVDKAEKPSAN